ncbi:carbonate dehydratase [Uncinocarpus reesii 1704]|uniref:Carbonic anhydrase n=1 Tax=Uncinocarpus reesii (strain UAMH 1704) TaxID=336963 RepID=C4JGU4_UNCRE|nr:carbonate dehydratase [Uncinocarpus reesii 1704]EEP77757.1 carbonate dehydratase [Uncinocarpus reesii 1704]
MATLIQQNLQSKNAEFASKFDKGHLALPPAKSYLVVTCMDARIDPAAAFGIDLGDAHVIRNAGANARDSLRSIVISQQLLGTKEILLVKHTGCGMLTFRNEDARALAEKNLGSHIKSEVEALDFQPFPELEEAVRKDVQWLKEQALVIPGIPISGWVYEVETGKARQIV